MAVAIRDATLAERFFLGLHASVPAALLVASLVQLFPPAQLVSPSLRPAWLSWAAIGLWGVLSLLLAFIRRRLLLWRLALAATAVMLLAAAGAGAALHAALSVSFALSLGLLGAACVALAPAIGPHQVRQHQQRADRRAQSPDAPLWRRLWAGLPFWVAGGLFAEAFRLAHIVGTEPQRGSGMVGMLVAFFLLLPAATLAPWMRRTAAVLAVASALVYAWLAGRSGLPQWWLAAGLSLMVAMQLLLRHAFAYRLVAPTGEDSE